AAARLLQQRAVEPLRGIDRPSAAADLARDRNRRGRRRDVRPGLLGDRRPQSRPLARKLTSLRYGARIDPKLTETKIYEPHRTDHRARRCRYYRRGVWALSAARSDDLRAVPRDDTGRLQFRLAHLSAADAGARHRTLGRSPAGRAGRGRAGDQTPFAETEAVDLGARHCISDRDARLGAR